MDRHTLAVSQSQGNATADYSPSPGSKPFLSCLALTLRLVSYAALLLQAAPWFSQDLLKSNWKQPTVPITRCALELHRSPVQRSQISVHLASAAVSNGSTDINMTQLMSKRLGRKGERVYAPHLALGVQLGLHAVLLIAALCGGERNICKHSSCLSSAAV